jgi:hypothetical protein
MPPTRSSAFSATVRVIHRIHCDTPYGWPDPTPSRCTGLAQRHQAVLGIANFSDDRLAVRMNLSHLPGSKPNRYIGTFLSHELGTATGAANHLRALTRFHLDAVNLGSNGDVPHRHAVARLYRCRILGDHVVTNRQAFRCDDVPTFAIQVFDQDEVGSPIRIVFQTLDDTRDSGFISFEIDNPVLLLVTTASMSFGNPTLVISSAVLVLFLDQFAMGLALVQSLGTNPNYETGTW